MKTDQNLRSILFESLENYFQQKTTLIELKTVSSLIKSFELINKKESSWNQLSIQAESQQLVTLDE